MDVFYYLHRGYDFDFIQRAMPSLTREQFDSVVEYVNAHREELVEKDRRMEEFHRCGMESQRARGGIFAESGENLTTEERLAQAQGKNEAEAASVGSGLAGVNLPSSLGARVCKTRSGNAIDLPSLSIPRVWQSGKVLGRMPEGIVA